MGLDVAFLLELMDKWLWVENRYPKWKPGKWNQGLTPAVPWRFNFDPQPNEDMDVFVLYWEHGFWFVSKCQAQYGSREAS